MNLLSGANFEKAAKFEKDGQGNDEELVFYVSVNVI